MKLTLCSDNNNNSDGDGDGYDDWREKQCEYSHQAERLGEREECQTYLLSSFSHSCVSFLVK
jgi:hypothetical protein